MKDGKYLAISSGSSMPPPTLDDFTWPMTTRQIIAAAGNSMTVPTLKLVFGEVLRCTGNFRGPSDPLLAYRIRACSAHDGLTRAKRRPGNGVAAASQGFYVLVGPFWRA